MKPNYKKFIQTERQIYANTKVSRIYSNGFNLTIKFRQNSTALGSTEVVLVKSKRTTIQMVKSRLEFILNDQLLTWFNIENSTQSNLTHTFVAFMNVDKLKFSLDDKKKELDYAENLEYLEIFMSEKLELNSLANSFVCLEQVNINSLRLPLHNGYSKEYKTQLKGNIRIININNKDCCSVSPMGKDLINNKLNNISLNGLNYSSPTVIIITIIVMVCVGLVAILTILTNIYFRNRNKKLLCHQSNIINQSSNYIINSSNFTSRNHLETSMESSSNQNSPTSSSSSFSGLTTTQSLSRNTFQSVVLNNQQNQDNYFEYDSAMNHNQVKALRSRIVIETKRKENRFLSSFASKINHFLSKKQVNKTVTNKQDNNVEQLQVPIPISNEKLFHENGLFNINDLDQLKNTLNWIPSFELYKSVFSDLENFTANNLITKEQMNNSTHETMNQNGIQLLSSSPCYRCDRQTFV